MSEAPDPICPIDDDTPPQTMMEILNQAHQILFRVAAMRDDPVILRNIAIRHLADTLTPADIRRVFGDERRGNGGGQ